MKRFENEHEARVAIHKEWSDSLFWVILILFFFAAAIIEM